MSDSPAVAAFIRSNPPTWGHTELLNTVADIADRNKTRGRVFVSHSQDHKKNPLTADQKIKHLSRISSRVDYESSSKEEPTILHKLSKIHAQGHNGTLHFVAGSDRLGEGEGSFRTLIQRYNGVEGPHGYYKFDNIKFHSSGERDPDSEGVEGVSGTKQREHAANNDFDSFKKGLPSHINDEHAKEMFDEVKQGMTPPPKAPKKSKSVKEEYMEDLLRFSVWKSLQEAELTSTGKEKVKEVADALKRQNPDWPDEKKFKIATSTVVKMGGKFVK